MRILLCLALAILVCAQAATLRLTPSIIFKPFEPFGDISKHTWHDNRGSQLLKKLAVDPVVVENAFKEMALKALSQFIEEKNLSPELTVDTRSFNMWETDVRDGKEIVEYAIRVEVSNKEGIGFGGFLVGKYVLKAGANNIELESTYFEVNSYMYDNLWPSIKTPVKVITLMRSLSDYNATGFMNNLTLLEEVFTTGYKPTIFYKPISYTLYNILFNGAGLTFSFKVKFLSALNETIDANVEIGMVTLIIPGNIRGVHHSLKFTSNETQPAILAKTPYEFKNTTELSYNPVLIMINNNLTRQVLAMGEKEVLRNEIVLRDLAGREHEFSYEAFQLVSISEETLRYTLTIGVRVKGDWKSTRFFKFGYLISAANQRVTLDSIDLEIYRKIF